MSVVIIGGNECMERRYKEICMDCGCSAKIYTKGSGTIRRKIGNPDLMIFFTDTVSHKMVVAAKQEAKRVGIPVARCQGSATALTEVLQKFQKVGGL